MADLVRMQQLKVRQEEGRKEGQQLSTAYWHAHVYELGLQNSLLGERREFSLQFLQSLASIMKLSWVC